MSENSRGPNPLSRRRFLKTGVAQGAAGVAVAAVGLHPKEAQAADNINWHRTADVVVVGAGVSGLACACAARDTGASVLMVISSQILRSDPQLFARSSVVAAPSARAPLPSVG